MSRNPRLYCATDKEIYDVLLSSKVRITSAVMLEWAKDRGIFYSPNDSRETLAHNLSLLPQDYYDLDIILERRAHSGRAEKLTPVILDIPLTIEDLKAVASDYKEHASSDEKVITHQKGIDKYIVKVQYSEIDYSKTRLIQRRQKEADIEFIVQEEKTVVRMPANAKAQEILHNLKNRLDGKKKTEIPTNLIELSEYTSSEKRTEFFTSLISKLPGFKLDNVTAVKVESDIRESDENELSLEDDEDIAEAEREMLAVVKNVALKGQSLLASNEYKQLSRRGFYITSIIWRSRQMRSPYYIAECEAAFEEPALGKGFKYNVRGAFYLQNEKHTEKHTKTIRPLPSEEKNQLHSLIEETAYRVLAEIRKKGKGVPANDRSEGEEE